MADARLRTAEAELLGLHRVGDVDGWEIPGRYLRFLGGAPATELAEVARHNDQDVRSLAWLLAHLEDGARRRRPSGRRRRRATWPGLARAFARERRLGEALACLEAAIDRPIAAPPERPEDDRATPPSAGRRTAVTRPADDEPWWSPRRPADFGGAPAGVMELGPPRTAQFDRPWTTERIAVERAHLLRRIGRHLDAVDAWSMLMAAGPGGPLSSPRSSSPRSASIGCATGPARWSRLSTVSTPIERRRRLGRPEPALEADLQPPRRPRLRRRLGPAIDGREAAAVRQASSGSSRPVAPTCETSLGTTARRTRSRARRTRTAARSGTAVRPGTLDRQRAGRGREPQVGRPARPRRPTIAGRRTDASSAARNVSPAPVGSISRSVAVGR